MDSLLKNTIAGLLIGLSLLAACKSSEIIPSETAPTDQVSLGLNKSARVKSDLTVRVDTLQDSRCPPNGQCIWEGIAYVSAVVFNATEQQRVRLYKNSQSPRTRQDSAGIFLSGQAYKVILRDVYQINQEQQAIIQVSKL